MTINSPRLRDRNENSGDRQNFLFAAFQIVQTHSIYAVRITNDFIDRCIPDKFDLVVLKRFFLHDF